jgi:hypothetical protein
MAERLSWWVIPGALVVLGHVVTLGRSAPPPAAPQPVDAAAGGPIAVVRDAAGTRSSPRPLAELTAGPLLVRVPGPRPAGRVAVTLWRSHDGVPEQRPWLQFDAPVRADGTIAIAGLAAGTYDVRCELPHGAVATAAAVDAPGRCTLSLAPAAPAR